MFKECLLVQRNLKLVFAVTLHNSQGSTQKYMKADFDRTSKTGKVNTVSVNQRALLMALSRAKLQLCNFDPHAINPF